ncbi:hypothetical protein [Lacisediminihabitans profunda]|uniref:hypothetical protein n=1 Tax=Lacisediminihabitans profunda TaxID=2594790 RepID=UPI0016508D51|nr:hypothetical protein [Lacisediminihabitans profunda]
MTTDLESLYRDLHAHPELGFAEHRTAGTVERGVSHLTVAALEWLAEGRDEAAAHG